MKTAEKKTVRKTGFFVLALILSLTLVGCGSRTKKKAETKTKSTGSNPKVCITVKGYGKIYFQLESKYAPKTVSNFMNLVHKKFYDGLTFHRVINGFMIQGGDPKGDGTGGSSKTIKGEFSANGVKNKLSHKRGVISMARSQDYNSASSQFFIVQKTSTYLDGQYASFGKVTKGMDVVDKIAKNVKVQDTNGTVAKKDQPVITSIREVK